MVKVRAATETDVPVLVRMGARLKSECPRYQHLEYDPEKVAALAHAVIPAGGAHVAEQDGKIIGVMAGFVIEHWFGHDKMASDFVFYVLPEHRGGRAALLLVSAFETWAASQGAKEVMPGVSAGVNVEGVEKFYHRLGYKTTGALFFKELP